MKRIKKILIRTLLAGLAFCLVVVLITSTTGFQIQKNPMDHFFSQHEPIDSLCLNNHIPKQLVADDIHYLVKTIEEVHPNPYHSITKEKFYYLTDSITQSIQFGITRKELLNKLTPLLAALNDGHTSIHFSEISKGQDNQSNFEREHVDSVDIVNYEILHEGTGYIYIKDFVMDKNDFREKLESIFKQIQQDSITNLIIDIRDNPGGNSELADILTSYVYDKPYKANSKILIKRSEQYYAYLRGYFSWWFRPFLRFIKQTDDYKKTPIGEIYADVKGNKNPVKTAYHFNGKKYLLINSNTFSTALGFATVFRDYDIGKIIGEPTKSEVNEFGDIYPFDLPNSRLWVWCSAKRYIRPSGEMTKGGLKPDIFVNDKNDEIVQYTIELTGNRN
ncbi:MAG TPA: S41 family peptidase [Bacteroidales bacterium]|nr:S41 family peptidase [Bacteroidales bacterium]